MNGRIRHVIYRHVAPNGQVYIGQSTYTKGRDFITRWANGNGYKSQSKVWEAIQKYGWENFKHECYHPVNYWESIDDEDYVPWTFNGPTADIIEATLINAEKAIENGLNSMAASPDLLRKSKEYEYVRKGLTPPVKHKKESDGRKRKYRLSDEELENGRMNAQAAIRHLIETRDYLQYVRDM